MNDIERCQIWVSDKTLAKLAWTLNVELHELFINTDDQSEESEDKKDFSCAATYVIRRHLALGISYGNEEKSSSLIFNRILGTGYHAL